MNLRRNLGYKLLSLGLGILLYATAEAQRNPRFPQDLVVVPRVENLPPTLALQRDPSTISVTVTGSSSAIQAFRAQTTKAVIDLRGAKAGSNRVPIRYQNDPAVLDIAGPLLADVNLESKASSSFHVDVQFDRSSPPPGLDYDEPVTDKRTVKVTGLASDVARVVRVAAIVDNADAGPVVGRPVPLIAQNASSMVIDGVQIVPPQVKVTISTHKALATKALVLSPDLEGAPAPGYALVGYEFEPRLLTVSGTQASLNRLSSLSVPVSLGGLKAPFVRQVTIPLPKGISVKDGESGTVRLRVDVQPIPTIATPPTPTPLPTATPASVPTPAATPSPERN